jgi:hypothetical protein
MLEDSVLRDYIATFNGYGDYRAKYWFVGMEEGGGGSLEEITRRFASWDSHGRAELSDLVSHHNDSDLSHFTSRSAKLQTTWSQLIRIILASEGRPTDNESVRAYQQSRLGRIGGETCLLELMPLPSPSTGAWLYGQYSSLPELRSRSEYMECYADSRARRLRRRVEEYRPPVVVFYSLKYMDRWRQIAGVELKPVLIGGVKSFSGGNEHTGFVVVPQPAYRMKGKGNDYYKQVGRAIGASLPARALARGG